MLQSKWGDEPFIFEDDFINGETPNEQLIYNYLDQGKLPSLDASDSAYNSHNVSPLHSCDDISPLMTSPRDISPHMTSSRDISPLHHSDARMTSSRDVAFMTSHINNEKYRVTDSYFSET